ncbi:hypothetical protein MC885_008270 [Smutsia gigantea]|nr:hypothetical protein MC885_008270 [Smutsia gigantea]
MARAALSGWSIEAESETGSLIGLNFPACLASRSRPDLALRSIGSLRLMAREDPGVPGRGRCRSRPKAGPEGSKQLGMGTENESPEPDCQKQFQAAVSVIQNLPKNGSYRPSYEEMLRFYSYYKQATMGPCLLPRPGFWDPIGRYKWDAWNSLGKMSREEAMSAYITEMKLVAQKVIDTVPLGKVAEDMFGYFEPLYQVIPDMPRPPETFLKRVTEFMANAEQGSDVTGRHHSLPSPTSGCCILAGWREKVLNGDAGAATEPPCLPKERAPPSPESQLPRDLDSEVFCDSLEQLEPELVRLPRYPRPHPTAPWLLNPHPGASFWQSSREPLEESLPPETASCPLQRKVNPCMALHPLLPFPMVQGSWVFPWLPSGVGEGSLLGPQDLDTWLVGTVRALQESMQNVQGRIQSLESVNDPPKQQRPLHSAQPWPLRLSGRTLLFFLLWPFIVQWLFRQFRTQKSLSPWRPFWGKLGLGPGPGRTIGWEAAGRGQEARPSWGRGEGRLQREASLPTPTPTPHTLRTSSPKIHLQMNVSLNKIKPYSSAVWAPTG